MLLLTLFLIFFEIGIVTFGGGYAMIPLIQAKLVGGGFLSLEEITDMIAISEMTPGPFAVNMATFTGMKLGGLPAAAVCTLGVVLPSLLIIMLVATVSSRMQENKTVKAVMHGIHPAVVGLIAAAALSIGKTALFPMGFAACISLSSLVLALLCLFSIKKCGLNPIVAIVASGVAGIFLFGGV